MRENRMYGSEGGEPSNGLLPYPYQTVWVMPWQGDDPGAACIVPAIGYSRVAWVPGPRVLVHASPE
ncbi:MAG: hypothetical protein PHD87_01100 [Candidatus Cloacimonetes bacterium]|nr:hypothetical protein [Candidatus Cloacimonadota bacterium]